jgi:glutamyl-tRNA reductase
MRSQLIVIHRPRTRGCDELFSQVPLNWIQWETCIRRLLIGLSPHTEESSLLAGDEVYSGFEAYQFLLETVCGLKSPVKAETEVHGQYREILEKVPVEHPLFKTLQQVHIDARKVRSTHLRGLGSQSYGSLARRTIKNTVIRARDIVAEEIHVLGAGALAREILPWLAKLDLPVHVHVRNPEKHLDLEKKFSSVKVHGLSDQPKGKSLQTLVVTAPVSSGYLAEWLMPRAQELKLVLDYRGESHQDPLKVSAQYFSLQDIFREIESTKQKVDNETHRATVMIQDLCKVV